MSSLFVVPVKPFGVAKARLSPVLDRRQRSRLGRAVAAHTIGIARQTGSAVAVVTADPGVAAWASQLGTEVIAEPPESAGLNDAARMAARVANNRGLGWLMLHADLPLLTILDLAAALSMQEPGTTVLTPSYNGGTSLVGGYGTDFDFRYGPESFHRHVAAAGASGRVLVRRGLVADLDSPRDLELARRLGSTVGEGLSSRC